MGSSTRPACTQAGCRAAPQLEDARRVEQDVLGLDVAVNDALGCSAQAGGAGRAAAGVGLAVQARAAVQQRQAAPRCIVLAALSPRRRTVHVLDRLQQLPHVSLDSGLGQAGGVTLQVLQHCGREGGRASLGWTECVLRLSAAGNDRKRTAAAPMHPSTRRCGRPAPVFSRYSKHRYSLPPWRNTSSSVTMCSWLSCGGRRCGAAAGIESAPQLRSTALRPAAWLSQQCARSLCPAAAPTSRSSFTSRSAVFRTCAGGPDRTGGQAVHSREGGRARAGQRKPRAADAGALRALLSSNQCAPAPRPRSRHRCGS